MSKLRVSNLASHLRFPGVGVHTFEVRSMALDDLFCPVRDVPTFADGVAKSIEQQGLMNPVIVVRGPREDLAREIDYVNQDQPNTLPDLPVCNVVYGGTNRIAAARALGYTHIDCVLLPTFELAMRVQDQQREGYNGTTATAVGTA